MLQSTEIPFVRNGLSQMVAVWQHADSKPLSYNRIGASMAVLCHGVNCIQGSLHRKQGILWKLTQVARL